MGCRLQLKTDQKGWQGQVHEHSGTDGLKCVYFNAMCIMCKVDECKVWISAWNYDVVAIRVLVERGAGLTAQCSRVLGVIQQHCRSYKNTSRSPAITLFDLRILHIIYKEDEVIFTVTFHRSRAAQEGQGQIGQSEMEKHGHRCVGMNCRC